jgi:hypothetical protein
LDHPVRSDRGSQFRKLRFIHLCASLERVAINLVKGDLTGFATLSFSSLRLHPGEKRIEALAEGASFGINGSGSHDFFESLMPASSPGLRICEEIVAPVFAGAVNNAIA